MLGGPETASSTVAGTFALTRLSACLTCLLLSLTCLSPLNFITLTFCHFPRDDQKIYSWNAAGECQGEVKNGLYEPSKTKEDAFITAFQWVPIMSGKGQAGGDAYVLGSTNGKVYLCSSKTGRVEKAADAHTGALLALKWNYDGSALVTGMHCRLS